MRGSSRPEARIGGDRRANSPVDDTGAGGTGARDGDRRLRVLSWHVHGSWQHSFVQGRHEYLLPTLPERGPWGLGRADRPWGPNAVEVPAAELREAEVDVVVLQRPEELGLVERWLGRRPGIDVPAVYVQHNTPNEGAATTEHVLSERGDITVVHVTDFNRLMWDCGEAPTEVIGHGIVDPGPLYEGDLARAVAVINEPVRRGRVAGGDLLPHFCAAAPVDVFGIKASQMRIDAGPGRHELVGGADLRLDELHRQMARRRVYVHPARWTSLGLSLLEAMHLAMPVAVVAATEAASFPQEVGVVSCDPGALVAGVRELIEDREQAVAAGKAAREYALANFGLEDFLRRWDALLARVAA
ncbi:glycosyltransferase [Glycomyces arizonensis]|uniref:glycosyltransferase n=1 Tax=Glycomyces arizonensis TaxID=256035 RepID=UPI000408FBDE|nr:glycosyltransferase [Glycomyces arizonensis]